ncbi:MAG: hypothetical protein C3F02_04260 [Parcubacteria group bacterium]|nr:MAG: hypothetical protein C3F02_04260 [Parcubacteria group bacterium]
MQIEYEATFTKVNKNDVRRRLRHAGAKLIYPEFLQKRNVFLLPKEKDRRGHWLRVRQEAKKITLSLKAVIGQRLTDQKEICLTVDNFEQASELLKLIGCQPKAYQESKRELWKIAAVEITIDEWPFLEPFVEIEGRSEKAIRNVARKLGFDYRQAMFGSVDYQYAAKYKIPLKKINRQTPLIVFKMKNPFLNRLMKNL